MFKFDRAIQLTTLIASSTATLPVLADQGGAGFALEEVVVTAQKREQSTQDVPISVQAFSSEDMRMLGASELSDLEASAPSLEFGGLGKGSQQMMGLRGIVDFSRNIGIDSRMGVYIDGVYQGRSYTSNQPLLDLESVEILRGPQGTLFGKNTVSGAINLNTKKPGEAVNYELGAESGSDNFRKFTAYASGPVSDDLYGSLSAAYQQADGYYRNLTLGKTVGDWDRTAVRGKLRYLPTDALELIVAADYGDTYSGEPLAVNRELEPYRTVQNIVADDTTKYWGTSLTANYAFDNDFTVTSITAYREADFRSLFDDDYTALDILTPDFDETSEQLSQELRLVSPMGEKFDWVAGIYFFDSNLSTERSATWGEDVYNELVPELAPFASGLVGTTEIPSTIDNTTMAAYLHGNYRFTEALELTAGLRYNKEDKDIFWQQTNSPADPELAATLEALTDFPLSQAPGVLFDVLNHDSFEDEISESDWSPTIGLNYFVHPEVMLYAKYSRAFKSGGWNADFVVGSLENFSYEPESVNSYELGIKSTLLDDSLRFNATAFAAKYDDYQVFQFITNDEGAVSIRLTNAGKVTSQGLEVETTWVPTERLRLSMNTTYLEARYDEFANPVPTQSDYDGNYLAYAPKWKTYLGLQYAQPLAGGSSLIFNLDYSYTDEQFSSASNVAVDAIDSYDLVNARLTFSPASLGWEVFVWGKNLADSAYNKVNSDNIIGTPRTVWGNRRTYGVGFTLYPGR